jgi:hypothetical protein
MEWTPDGGFVLQSDAGGHRRRAIFVRWNEIAQMNDMQNLKTFPTKSVGFLVMANLFLLSIVTFFAIHDWHAYQPIVRAATVGTWIVVLPFLLGLAADSVGWVCGRRNRAAVYHTSAYHKLLQIYCIVLGLAVLSFGVFGVFYELGKI